MRRFCLWAIGLALLTLRKIQANPQFTDGSQVKVSRRSVQATVLTTNLAVADDDRLRHLFHMTAHDLPALTPKLADDPGRADQRYRRDAEPAPVPGVERPAGPGRGDRSRRGSACSPIRTPTGIGATNARPTARFRPNTS